MLMDLWTYSFFEKFETCEPCLLVYMHEETPCKWTVLDPLDFESLETCKSYHMGEMTERPRFQWDETREQLVRSNTFDVCNPMSAEARSEYRYALTSQMIWVDSEYIYLMKHESELLKGSSNFRVKLKIVVTRGWNVCDMIIEMSIWVTSLAHN